MVRPSLVVDQKNSNYSNDEIECIPDENNEPSESECDGIEELEMSM